MKDLFSTQSELYRQARPQYSQQMMDEILKHVSGRGLAWDCGAGSGQFSQLLAPWFEQVVATDISAAQLQQAPFLSNVRYEVQAAEQSSLPSESVDLITVAQAIHWFNFDAFYAEVRRVLKPDGVLAALGYGLIQIEQASVQHMVQHLYTEVLKGWWDAERHYIDEHYQTIPFPLTEIQLPELVLHYEWTAEQLLNYLNTWSALKHYRQQRSDDPLAALQSWCAAQSTTDVFSLSFPVLMRLGTIS